MGFQNSPDAPFSIDIKEKLDYKLIMNNQLPPEDIEFLWRYEAKLRNSLPKFSKIEVPYRIRLKSTGDFIKLSSGKTIWPRIGAAKAALRNDIPNIVESLFNSRKHKVSGESIMDYSIIHNRREKAVEEFVANWVDFVPCPSRL